MADQVELETTRLAAVRGSVPMDGLPAFFDTAYPAVARAAAQEGWTLDGPAIGWYPAMSTDVVQVAAGFPVSGASTGAVSGTVAVLEVAGGPALVATHTGSYDGLPDAWERLEQERVALGVDGRGDFWEEYVTEPSPGGDPSANVTRLVLPLRTGS
ncbi:GyrI-like domain-containing protein [Cellulomonas oligotrophica]|uniref:Effector-binding domain-containing protein n=1 Tax=Cellulomonas oligotrophica TaxID=931536 RepID=A0A7Y9FGC5_9CELL|nr:GyrI-like domain-containing protein [Cellulomonas oligotrophica]NYD86517.1 effector-binding domain-containing protein [Cellulomonas oligotrophica]GIG32593.1 transcriptional regulator [Cellulomonas oligotrophica]